MQTLCAGPRQSLKEAQAQNGFAYVDEQTCEEFLTHEGKNIPEGSEDGENHRKTELAMACIAAVKPGWSSVDAAAALSRGFAAEHPHIYEHIHVPTDALEDVVDKGEVRKVVEWEEERKREKLLKEQVLHTRDAKMASYFEIAKPPTYSTGQRKVPHWLPKRDEDKSEKVTGWLLKYAPTSVTIQTDDHNGRWRIISPNFDSKSVSWTRRGFQEAAFEALHVAWSFDYDFTGQPAPFKLEDLVPKFIAETVG